MHALPVNAKYFTHGSAKKIWISSPDHAVLVAGPSIRVIHMDKKNKKATFPPKKPPKQVDAITITLPLPTRELFFSVFELFNKNKC